MFEGFFSVVAQILDFFYSLTHSFGVAIILLTLLVMLITAPLTLKSTRSMLQMQRHQPELKRIQAEFKGDRERMNQEVMAFYKENSINPMSGCFPMLIQAPIFIILYQVLRGITERSAGRVSAIGRAAGTILTPGEVPVPFVINKQVFEPRHLKTTDEMYQALVQRNKMNFLGVDLAISPAYAWKLGLATFIPAAILMVAMLISQIYQNRQIQGRQPNGSVNPQQQMMMKIVPFMLPIFSFTFPIGLGLYYFVQGLCRIGLQGYITKKVYHPHQQEMASKSSEKPVVEAKATEKAKGSGGTPDKKAATAPTSKSAKAQASKAKSQQGATGSGRKSGAPRSKTSDRSKS